MSSSSNGLILLFVFCFGWNCKGFVEAQCPAPSIPVNSRAVNITGSSYTLICTTGHALNDGSTQVQFSCQRGRWIPNNPALGESPRCLASCNPACQNGGRCVPSENFCECLTEFRGKYCQYSADACDVSKLNLTNQITSCGSSDETLDCIILCPDGFEFETKPEDVYTCVYKDGKFSGTPPRCVQQCTNGAKLFPCAPNAQPDCLGRNTLRVPAKCVEGCYCPEGTFREKDQCVPKSQCPCIRNGVSVPIGDTINVECNTCTCKEGQNLECTTNNCGAVCSIIADPHYTNFNGLRFDYMGKCSYYFLISDTFTIEGENTAWGNGGFLSHNEPNYANYPSCVSSVTVRTALYNITIGQKQVVTVNGKTIVDLPLELGNLRVRRISSQYTAIELNNGVSVQFDGLYSAYVNVPFSFKGRTKGMCGTFGGDDAEILKNINEYGELWNTDAKCDSGTGNEKHPCEVNPENKAEAERLCGKLKGDVFKACETAVPPNNAYDNCLYDLCASGTKTTAPLCGTLANYAKECAAKGVVIEWRNQVEECAIPCPRGQVYKVCHNACKRTCADISLNVNCQNQCTEGCNCPDGQAFDRFDRCIPIADCPCTFDGWTFSKGFRRREDNKVCTCDGGSWTCKEEDPDVIKELPDCDARNNLTLRDFIPVASKTCKNMHEVTTPLPGATCICRDGKVFGDSGVCVPAEECPCYYAGRSYEEGAVVKRHCEQCKCSRNRWSCSQQPCLGECNVWGQGHYQTFDVTTFDFNGICEYVLSAGSQPGRSYQITTKYSKEGSIITLQTVTIRVTVRERTETLILRRDQTIYPLPRFREIIVHDSVALIDIESSTIGLRVQWDRANGLYVKVESSWKRNTHGICGDYDGDDDETTINPAWHSGDDCTEPTSEQQDCLFGRVQTALLKCRILKSELFSTCNRVIDPEDYMAKCINDLCHRCEDADDNTALCPVLAAYNQECINQGILINWRTNELCPLQCGANEKLGSTGRCPTESCEDVNNSRKLCSIDTDCEACVTSNKCSANSVFASRWNNECVPKSTCKEVCLQLKGVTYYEGDVLETIGRTVCRCEKGKKVCK